MNDQHHDSTHRRLSHYLWDNCDHSWDPIPGQIMVMAASQVIDRLGEPPGGLFTSDDQLLIEICHCKLCGLHGAEVEVVTP